VDPDILKIPHMDPETLEILCAAEEAVRRLAQECRRGGRVYHRSPRAVAQVGRNAKWLLSAIAALHRAFDDGGDGGAAA
jgi:hypothetical protein